MSGGDVMEYIVTILLIYYLYMTFQSNTNVVDGCFERGRVMIGDWNLWRLDLWDGLKMGYPNAIHNRSETDTHFVVQGEGNEVFFTI